MLKTTTVTVKKLDVYDLDKAITEFLKSKNYHEKNFDKYGYEAVAENEWSNYQEHSFDVSLNMPSDEEKSDIAGLGTGGLLDWMCAEGQVEAGEYLVSCFW